MCTHTLPVQTCMLSPATGTLDLACTATHEVCNNLDIGRSLPLPHRILSILTIVHRSSSIKRRVTAFLPPSWNLILCLDSKHINVALKVFSPTLQPQAIHHLSLTPTARLNLEQTCLIKRVFTRLLQTNQLWVIALTVLDSTHLRHSASSFFKLPSSTHTHRHTHTHTHSHSHSRTIHSHTCSSQSAIKANQRHTRDPRSWSSNLFWALIWRRLSNLGKSCGLGHRLHLASIRTFFWPLLGSSSRRLGYTSFLACSYQLFDCKSVDSASTDADDLPGTRCRQS